MTTVRVDVAVIEPTFENKGKSLFSGSAGEPKYDEKTARPVRSIESSEFNPSAPPRRIDDIFSAGGWVDLAGTDSHFVLGEIKLKPENRFRIAGSKHGRVLLVTLALGPQIVATTRIELGHILQSGKRRGHYKLNRVTGAAGYPLVFLFHEISVAVGDDIDLSTARRTVSAVALPTTSNTYKGTVPPRTQLMDIDTIAFAIDEAEIKELITKLRA